MQTKKFAISIPQDLHEEMKAAADKRMLPLSRMIAVAWKEWQGKRKRFIPEQQKDTFTPEGQ